MLNLTAKDAESFAEGAEGGIVGAFFFSEVSQQVSSVHSYTLIIIAEPPTQA